MYNVNYIIKRTDMQLMEMAALISYSMAGSLESSKVELSTSRITCIN